MIRIRQVKICVPFLGQTLGKERTGNMIKEMLAEYDLLFFTLAITIVSVLLKLIGAFLFGKLVRESAQMGTTKNKWMKAMMAKFEAYYKLRISIHNVENFVDRYLYQYRVLGLSLDTWKNAGLYGSAVVFILMVLNCLLCGWFLLPMSWLFFSLLISFLCLTVLGVFELLCKTRRAGKVFRIQIVDYMENTMRAKLENEYFHQEENKQYQREYFSSPQGEKKKEPQEMKQLVNSLLQEAKLDKQIKERQQQLESQSSSAEQRARLFEEVLSEYMP